MVVWLVLAGLLGVLIILGWWGAMTATTALTLAMTNAVQQTMMTILACTLLTMMPLLLFGAFKLGEVLGERKRAVRDPVSAPPIEQERGDVLVEALPSPELPALPSDVSNVIRAPHTSRHVRSCSDALPGRLSSRAMRIAQRWFR